MKKVFAALLMLAFAAASFALSEYSTLVEAARKYAEEENYVYALGAYYDALCLNEDSDHYNSDLVEEEFSDLCSFIYEDYLGTRLGQYNVFKKKWFYLMEQFEKYWCENCPVSIGVGGFQQEAFDESTKKYSYSFEIEMDFTQKFETIGDGIYCGFEENMYALINAKSEEYLEDWPYSSVHQDEASALQDGSGLLRIYSNELKKTMNIVAPFYFYEDLSAYDMTFDICDDSGKTIAAGIKTIAYNGKEVVIKGISEKTARLFDQGKIQIVLKALTVPYGKVSKVDSKSRSWLKGLPVISYDVKAVEFYQFDKSRTAAKGEGKVLNIYSWNEEFQDRFNSYCASKLPADVTVNWVITPNEGNAYQNKLDEALLSTDKLPADARVDLFLVESDYALKYVDTEYTLDIKKDIGLTDADLSNQFQFTKDIGTANGNLKAVTWQACPGGFIYRRSYAREVLGTDDPNEVQEMLSDWTKFDEVAQKMKRYGYCMLSGYDDDFRVFYDNMSSPWVADGKINIDPSIQYWINQTKKYSEKGYNNRASLWTNESTQGMMKDGKVFGYFGPDWFIDFCMPYDEGSAFGDWAFCKGPQGYFWGGSWLCVASGTDNVELIRDILYTLTCDTDVMTTLAKEKGGFVNNEKSMTEIACSDYGNDFLAGQNPISFFIDSAKSIDRSNMSAYDLGMNEKLQSAMKGYFNGYCTLDEAWDDFYALIGDIFPNLMR